VKARKRNRSNLHFYRYRLRIPILRISGVRKFRNPNFARILKLPVLKSKKMQIITFIAATFQQTHPFNFTLNFKNVTIIRTTKQLAKCNSLRKCSQLSFSQTSKIMQLPVMCQNECVRIFMKLYTINFANFYDYYTQKSRILNLCLSRCKSRYRVLLQDADCRFVSSVNFSSWSVTAYP